MDSSTWYTVLGGALILLFMCYADGPRAEPGGEGTNTGCNGTGNPNSPCAPAPNPPVLVPGNTTIIIDGGSNNASSQGGNANAESTSNSSSISGSHSSAVAHGEQSQSQTTEIQQGATATSGTSISFSGGEYPSAGAADVYAAVCTNGASGQTRGGGFAIGNGDPLCDQLKVAVLYYKLAKLEDELGNFEQALEYYELAHNAVSEAQTLLDATDEVALIDRFAGYLVRPMALLGALIWLL